MINFTELYSVIKIIGIYIKNKIGPRTQPYGKPHFMEALLETCPLIEIISFVITRMP